MKNIIQETPYAELHGRPLYSTRFVSDQDILEKDILEVGCGFWYFLVHAEKKWAKHITGIEITENNLSTARQCISSDKIRLEVWSAICIPFSDNSFDTVISWEVIEHIPKNTELAMFKEVCRVLKKGGVFYLSTPYHSLFSNLFDPAWWLIGHRHYTKKHLMDFAQNNGFTVEKMVTNGGWWELLDINNLYIAKWIFRRPPFFEAFFNTKRNREYAKENGFTNIFVKFKKQ